MFPRYFWTFCTLALVAVVVSVSAQEAEIDSDYEYDESSMESIEIRISFGRKVEKILKKFFKNATEHCIKMAIGKCKKYWYNPGKVISCAKDLFSIENAACLVDA